MKTSILFKRLIIVFAVCAAPLWSQQTQTAPSRTAPDSKALVLQVDTAKSTVHWSVESSLHTVHGTFRVKRGGLSINSATSKASGEIVVDASSGESGNDSRDHKMHKEVLESERYNEIIFKPERVDGAVARQGASNVTLHGIFTLHGTDHEFSAPVKAQLDANGWKGSAAVEVPYVDWKLKNPGNFLLKVKPVVLVDVELAGNLQGASAR